METCTEVLTRLTPVLEELGRRATLTDQASVVPRQHLRDLAAAGLFSLEASPEIMWEVSERLAAACGVTHFVQAQHAGAIKFLAQSDNHPLAEEALLAWRRGERFCGVAFAHLRRSPSPVTMSLQGEELVFDGQAPWFSGWGVMDEVVVGGRLEDGRNAYVLVSLRQPGIEASEPLELAAMNASATVTLRLDGLRVPASRLVMIQTQEEMSERDWGTLLRYAAPPLGVVRAACDLLDPSASTTHRLRARAAELRRRGLAWSGGEEEATSVRTQANLLALHAAQAAVVGTGGNGIRRDHPAQRLLREASFYYLTQLTAPLRRAALASLAD